MSLLRRYAPFTIPVVVLLILVLVTPSKAPQTRVSAGAAVASGGLPPKGSPPPGVNRSAGSTAHCVAGKQFFGVSFVPPCEPDWTGKGNPGATSAGVTKDTIEVVYYRDADDPAVKAVTSAAGGYTSPSTQATYVQAATQFINSKYELWNRKLKIDYFQGKCTPTKPDPTCFNGDAKALVQRYKPFAVIYQQNTNAPTFFQTLTQLGVVSLGGWGFTAAYNGAQNGYHYDLLPDGDYQAQLLGTYWCSRLVGKPARFAGSAELRSRTRKAAVIAVDSPENVKAAEAAAAAIRKCDKNGAEVVKYSADTTTAISQSTVTISRVKAAGVTDLVWFSDPVAPALFGATATAQQFFPENVLGGGSVMDSDGFGATYGKGWANAFGPGDGIRSQPLASLDSTRVWKAVGRSGTPDLGSYLTWGYLSALAAGLQEAGPTLTPANFQRGFRLTPSMGGGRTGFPLVGLEPNRYTAVEDARDVYFDATKISPQTGKPGTYVELENGQRYTPGTWPRTEPAIPTAASR